MATTINTSYAGARTASALNVLAGIWLIISPFILGFQAAQNAMWDTLLVGVAVLIFSWIRSANPAANVGLSWVNLLLGIWLIISPFVLAYANLVVPMRNDVIMGIIVAILAIWSAVASA